MHLRIHAAWRKDRTGDVGSEELCIATGRRLSSSRDRDNGQQRCIGNAEAGIEGRVGADTMPEIILKIIVNPKPHFY
jgi:hypothetical protein